MRILLWLLLLNGPVLGQWKAGFSTKVITPEGPLWMAGYAARKEPSKGKQHDLFVKCATLEDPAGTRLVLLTSDLCGIPRNLADDVLAAAMMRTGLKRDAILLTCSHTHSGPVVRENLMDMYDMPEAQRERVREYYPKLRDAMIEAIVESAKTLEPATLTFGAGEAGFAMNRRQATQKGVALGTNPKGPVDKSVPVLAIAKPGGGLRGVVFGYACHNTTLDGLDWSGDYAGYAQIELEKSHPGAVAMFWSGCGADANPHPRREVARAVEYGKSLATAVGKVLAGKMTPLTKAVKTHFEEITLDYAELPSREALLKDAASTNYALKTRANRFLNQIAGGTPLEKSYSRYPIQSWVFGDELAWVALGGEVVVDYALRLKKEHTSPLWVTGYANDVMAYIPSERVLKEGGYEADSSMIYYGLPSKWKSGLEEKIVAAVQRALKPLANGEPKTPQDEKATFQLVPGYRIDLVAAEPEVIDPVAMAFDHTGAIYVCEMIGYPNGGVATGVETRGRVRKLLDKNGDGYYETAITFVEGLRFPTGLCCWRDGVIVANAPDITFFRDTDGDHKSDKSQMLYTGFDLRNIQQLPNSLQFYRDGYIHAMVGLNGGTITCPAKPDMPPLELRGRGIRFKPDEPGVIEPISGGGQYGLTHDGMGHWFTNTNAQHLRQIVIPDHYLKRNPHFAASAVTVDIAEHGPAAKVFRISPFEAWRLERTTRRKNDPATAKRLTSMELVPGGYFTSACSPLCYRGTQFDEHTVFVCDPANNLIHREKLHETNGPLFVAKRIDEGKEFLASTDNWFRPVFLTQGPDDALYVLDFYREAIETPLSLPDDIKKRMNLESRHRGRIWRIAKSDSPIKVQPALNAVGISQIRNLLDSQSSSTWQRDTAYRLLFERMNNVDVMGMSSPSASFIQLMAAKGALSEKAIVNALKQFNDPQLMTLAEPYLSGSQSELSQELRKRLQSNSPQVRFQTILSLGADPQFKITSDDLVWLKRDVSDPWFAAAVMTSMLDISSATLQSLVEDTTVPAAFVRQSAAIYAAKHRDLPDEFITDSPRTIITLEGIATGLRQSGSSLEAFWLKHPEARDKARRLFEAQEKKALDGALSVSKRVQAMRLLDLRAFEERARLAQQLLLPSQPHEVQAAAVQSLASSNLPSVSRILLDAWPKATPGIRTILEEALMARPERVEALLNAIEAKTIEPRELGSLRIDQLRNHRDAAIRNRAVKLLATAVNEDRKKVIDDYQASLELSGDEIRGKTIFAKQCASCHKLENVGNDVGANLTAALPNKTKAALLIDILDPSREVDPRFVNYTVQTASGRSVSGILAVETATSITLRRGEKAEDTILRNDIESLTASKKSLMPEDLEKVLSKQDLSDVFVYLLARKP